MKIVPMMVSDQAALAASRTAFNAVPLDGWQPNPSDGWMRSGPFDGSTQEFFTRPAEQGQPVMRPGRETIERLTLGVVVPSG